MKTEFKSNFKIWHTAAAKLATVGLIATLAVTATATIAHGHTAPSAQMETITVTAKRIRTERMSTIIVSASRFANICVARSPMARISNVSGSRV